MVRFDSANLVVFFFFFFEISRIMVDNSLLLEGF